jgi:hypothetical protein
MMIFLIISDHCIVLFVSLRINWYDVLTYILSIATGCSTSIIAFQLRKAGAILNNVDDEGRHFEEH